MRVRESNQRIPSAVVNGLHCQAHQYSYYDLSLCHSYWRVWEYTLFMFSTLALCFMLVWSVFQEAVLFGCGFYQHIQHMYRDGKQKDSWPRTARLLAMNGPLRVNPLKMAVVLRRGLSPAPLCIPSPTPHTPPIVRPVHTRKHTVYNSPFNYCISLSLNKTTLFSHLGIKFSAWTCLLRKFCDMYCCFNGHSIPPHVMQWTKCTKPELRVNGFT